MKRERIVRGDRPPVVQDVKRIMDGVVVLDITFHRAGIRRKADLSKVETESDRSMLGLTKAIVDSDEYDAVLKLGYETRDWVAKRGLPSPLKRGTFLVPVNSIVEVYEHLDEIEIEFDKRVDAFLKVYPRQVEEAREKLLDQFDEDNYPSAKQLKMAFWLERRLLDFGVPNEKKIGIAIWKKEKERAEKTWQLAVDDIQIALREAFRNLVGHLAERLELKPDGTKKVFAESAITKIIEFIDLFKNRNLTGDSELEGLVAQARDVLAGKKADALRKNVVARGEVAGEMARVTAALDELLETAPRRRISLDDD